MTAGYALTGAAQIARLTRPGLRYLRHHVADSLSLEPGDLFIAGDRIADAAGDHFASVDCSGAAVIPGFVDCHTHLPFAGWRAEEYEQKVTGVPYAEITRRGGGIRSSARAFASASDEEVLAQATALAAEMLPHGTTTFECKSGYGLSIDAELRSLRLASELDGRVEQTTRSTALLAHAIPDGCTADSWMDAVAEAMPRVKDQTRATALDIFRRVGGLRERAPGAHGRTRPPVRARSAHARRAAGVARVGARGAGGRRPVCRPSVVPARRARGTARRCRMRGGAAAGGGVLGAEHRAPARALVDACAVCVLSTDANPGTSPVFSLPLIAGLAVRMYGWSAREALLALTLNAAWVLRLSGELGALERGRRAHVVVLDGPGESIAYRLGHNPVAAVFVAGRPLWIRDDQRWRFPD